VTIRHRRIEITKDSLSLGYKGKSISFEHRPYRERKDLAQADYDRLLISLFHDGMRDPLITYRAAHVLIGQRRFEIMSRLGQSMFHCADILEDVSLWGVKDIERLEAFKKEVGQWTY